MTSGCSSADGMLCDADLRGASRVNPMRKPSLIPVSRYWTYALSGWARRALCQALGRNGVCMPSNAGDRQSASGRQKLRQSRSAVYGYRPSHSVGRKDGYVN